MKKLIVTMVYVLSVFLIIASVCNFSMAADANDIYNVINGKSSEGSSLFSITGTIIGIIRWVGTAILIGAIMLKGIKYITSSPEGKAEIKKDIIMLVVGAILLFAITTIVDIIYDLVGSAGLRQQSMYDVTRGVNSTGENTENAFETINGLFNK